MSTEERTLSSLLWRGRAPLRSCSVVEAWASAAQAFAGAARCALNTDPPPLVLAASISPRACDAVPLPRPETLADAPESRPSRSLPRLELSGAARGAALSVGAGVDSWGLDALLAVVATGSEPEEGLRLSRIRIASFMNEAWMPLPALAAGPPLRPLVVVLGTGAAASSLSDVVAPEAAPLPVAEVAAASSCLTISVTCKHSENDPSQMPWTPARHPQVWTVKISIASCSYLEHRRLLDKAKDLGAQIHRLAERDVLHG